MIKIAAAPLGVLSQGDQYMRLTPPKQVTFYISISVALISVVLKAMAVTGVTVFPTGGYFTGGYLVLLVAYLVLLAGITLKGV